MLESKALAELLKTLTVKCDDDESGQIIMKIIGLIIGLSENADVIKQFNDAGGFLYLINLLLNSANDIKVRAKAAELFIHISVAETSPELTADKICEIYLTSKFKSKFEEASSGFAKYFFSDHKVFFKINVKSKSNLSFYRLMRGIGMTTIVLHTGNLLQ